MSLAIARLSASVNRGLRRRSDRRRRRLSAPHPAAQSAGRARRVVAAGGHRRRRGRFCFASARRAAAAWRRSSGARRRRDRSEWRHPPLEPFDVSITKGHEHHAVLFSKWNSFSRIGVYDQPYGDWSLSERYTGPLPDTRLMDIDSAAGDADPALSAATCATWSTCGTS